MAHKEDGTLLSPGCSHARDPTPRRRARALLKPHSHHLQSSQGWLRAQPLLSLSVHWVERKRQLHPIKIHKHLAFPAPGKHMLPPQKGAAWAQSCHCPSVELACYLTLQSCSQPLRAAAHIFFSFSFFLCNKKTITLHLQAICQQENGATEVRC